MPALAEWKKCLEKNMVKYPQFTAKCNQMSHLKVPPPNLVNFWDFSLDHLKVPSSPLRIETSQELRHCGDYAGYRLTMCNHNHLYPGIHVSMLLLLSISNLMHLNRKSSCSKKYLVTYSKNSGRRWCRMMKDKHEWL